MVRRQLLLLIGLAMLLVCSTQGFTEQTNQETFYKGSDGAICIPMGNFMIDPPPSVKRVRASVDFPHARHFVYNCNLCHHKWDYVSPVKTCRTSGCHDQFAPTKKPLKDGSYTDAAMKYYKYAYHNKCRGCHQEIQEHKREMTASLNNVKELPQPGPTGCLECHPK